MQVDMHYAAIYVLCRLAGMQSKYASIVAYSSQHVDDTDEEKLLRFENGEIFKLPVTSHSALSERNFEVRDALEVWVPFHFLPRGKDDRKGEFSQFKEVAATGQAKALGNAQTLEFGVPDTIDHLITAPNSKPLHLLKEQLKAEGRTPLALYRLGIGLHVYADTYSHQDFKGFYDNYNNIQLESVGDETLWRKVVRKCKEKLLWPFEKILSSILPRVGHGRAITFPDLPYAVWAYKRGKEMITVENLHARFYAALESIFRYLLDYLAENPQYLDKSAGNRSAKDFYAHKAKILELLAFDGDKDERLAKWMQAIHNNAFNFPSFDELDQTVQYDEEAWFNDAISYHKIPWWKRLFSWPPFAHRNFYEYRKKEGFVNSHWVNFMRAAERHRYKVIHEILPLCQVEVG